VRLMIRMGVVALARDSAGDGDFAAVSPNQS